MRKRGIQHLTVATIVLTCLIGVVGCNNGRSSTTSADNKAGSASQSVNNAVAATNNTTSNVNNSSRSSQTQGSTGSSGSGGTANNSVASTPPTPPPILASEIPFTALSNETVTKDRAKLNALFHKHPGDNITRGPSDLIYNIGMVIHPSRHDFQAILSVHFTNNLGMALDKLYFNVWPDSLHYQSQGSNEVISSVTVDGVKADFHLTGTVLTVVPSQPVAKGKSAEVRMDVSAILPHNTDRYGWEGTGINLGNWYPILAVHDQNDWVTPPYYSQGESFYSLTGAYHVTIRAPKNLVLAVTGAKAAKRENPDGTVTETYTATGVRDTAIVANTAYKVLQGKVGNVTVYTYYTDAQANQSKWMEESAIRAVRNYDQWYGPYPFTTLRICAMRGWFGGMEYPQLDMVSFQPSGNTMGTTQLIVDHEVAHQWFYGLVGDDEYLTPMMDESFAEFSQSILDKAYVTLTNVPSSSSTAEPSDPVSAFSDASPYPYFNAVYLDGANVLFRLYTKLGAADFHDMMSKYVQEYAYRVATIPDFVNFVSHYTGTNMTPWFLSHGVNASDGLKPTTQLWAQAGMQENGVSWHHSS